MQRSPAEEHVIQEEQVDLLGELHAIRSRERDLRRTRGDIACAECRRLKLKCDRKVPCLTCIRRGCENICPTSVSDRVREPPRRARKKRNADSPPTANTSTNPTSSAPSNSAPTSSLLSKLIAISDRVRALENALQAECMARQELERRLPSLALDVGSEREERNNRPGPRKAPDNAFRPEATFSSVNRVLLPVHPLLASDLLDVKKGIETYIYAQNESNGVDGTRTAEDESTSEMMSAFGTLSVRDAQMTRFMGANHTEESLLSEVSIKEDSDLLNSSLQELSDIPSDVAQAGELWPFAPAYLTSFALAGQIAAHLPPFERAITLCEAYFTGFSGASSPIDRPQAFEELVPLFYPHGTESSIYISGLVGVAAEHVHDLALLFALLACGSVSEIMRGFEFSNAERYIVLAKAALGLRSVFEDGSLSACQAIFLLSASDVYRRHALSGSTLKMTSLALSLAIDCGLNRDPERWNLASKMVERRRKCFWEIYVSDLWGSMSSGRPATFRPNDVDVQFPNIRRDCADDGENQIGSVQEWRYRFARDVLTHLSEKLSSAHAIKYSEILELDRKVRNFKVFSYTTHPGLKSSSDTNPNFSSNPLITVWYRETSLLYIHRNFFAKAMIDFPEDPLRSVFAPSVLATYRSASVVLRNFREQFGDHGRVLLYIWPVWARAVSCAVIMASVAAKGKALSFSMAAFQELELCLALFEKINLHPVVQHVLPSLKLLRKRAYAVLFEKSSAQRVHHTPTIDGNSDMPLEDSQIGHLAAEEPCTLNSDGRQRSPRTLATASPQSAETSSHVAVQASSPPSESGQTLNATTTDTNKSKTGATSNIVSSTLFHEAMMAQLIEHGRFQDTKAVADHELNRAPKEQSLANEASQPDRADPNAQAWSDVSIASTLQALGGNHDSETTLTHDRPLSGPAFSSDFDDIAMLFSQNPPDWAAAAAVPDLEQGLESLMARAAGESISGFHSDSTFGFCFDETISSDAGFGAGSNSTTTINANGERDWTTFLQLAGFPGPEADSGRDGAGGLGKGMDWESLGFS